jgi:hypothetical protein
MSLQQTQPSASHHTGSLDGIGSADHDQPYVFGRRPSAAAPYPFSTRQYARLLLMRSRLAEAPLAFRTTTCEHPSIQPAS